MTQKSTKIDEEALAEAYNRALSLEKSGSFDAAADAYAEVLALAPGFGAHKKAWLVVWPGLARCREFTRARALLVRA